MLGRDDDDFDFLSPRGSSFTLVKALFLRRFRFLASSSDDDDDDDDDDDESELLLSESGNSASID